MSFATVADLLARISPVELAQLADRTKPRLVTDALLTAGAAGNFAGMTQPQIDAVNAALGLIQSALDDATEVCRSYVLTRYPGVLTLHPVPKILVRSCCDIARADLYQGNVPELVNSRAEKAEATLRDVSRGIVTLGEEDATANVIASDDSVEMTSSQVRMSRENGRGFL